MNLTQQIRYVKVEDSSVTTGAGLTGKVFSDFTAALIDHVPLVGTTRTSLTTQTVTTLGTFQAPTSQAHIRIRELNSSTPTAGVYEVHFHDDQFVLGSGGGEPDWLELHLSVSGGRISPFRVEQPLHSLMQASDAPPDFATLGIVDGRVGIKDNGIDEDVLAPSAINKIRDGVAGPGADECTITVQISGDPVPDADVWITSDEEGEDVIAGTLQTNSSGEARFMLDAGETYYLWLQKDGVNSIQGEEFIAEAD